jgi:hypothetical protein
MPTLYVCVYRRHVPSPAEWRAVVEEAKAIPILEEFVSEYWRPDRFFDWGDDPGFFSAIRHFGDAQHASWGVCRRDVRSAVRIGDAVAFFVARPVVRERRDGIHVAEGPVDYFYVGCGTVGRLASRDELWSDPSLATYCSFFNVLARPSPSGELVNVEVFPRHEDWMRRAEAPLVLFDIDRSAFSPLAPHAVGRFEPSIGVPETWRADEMSRRLEALLFGDGRPRRLRTSHIGYGHAKRVIRLPDAEFALVRDELVAMAARAASEGADH